MAGAQGLSNGAFESLLADPSVGAEVDETAAEAGRRGAFGVPTFFAGERMFWGNDRIVLLRHHLLKEAD